MAKTNIAGVRMMIMEGERGHGVCVLHNIIFVFPQGPEIKIFLSFCLGYASAL